jgi:hypothetical protein
VRLRELARESFPDDKLAAEIAMRKAFDAKEAYFRGAGGDALILFFYSKKIYFIRHSLDRFDAPRRAASQCRPQAHNPNIMSHKGLFGCSGSNPIEGLICRGFG